MGHQSDRLSDPPPEPMDPPTVQGGNGLQARKPLVRLEQPSPVRAPWDVVDGLVGVPTTQIRPVAWTSLRHPLNQIIAKPLGGREVLEWPYTVGGGEVTPPPPWTPPKPSDRSGKKRNLPLGNLGGPFLVHNFLGPRAPPPPSCKGARPIGAAEGKQTNTMASCQPPPPLYSLLIHPCWR